MKQISSMSIFKGERSGNRSYSSFDFWIFLLSLMVIRVQTRLNNRRRVVR